MWKCVEGCHKKRYLSPYSLTTWHDIFLASGGWWTKERGMSGLKAVLAWPMTELRGSSNVQSSQYIISFDVSETITHRLRPMPGQNRYVRLQGRLKVYIQNPLSHHPPPTQTPTQKRTGDNKKINANERFLIAKQIFFKLQFNFKP